MTDAQGRYLVPDLPPGRYRLWVRGYGLVDSPRVEGTPGTRVNLAAVVAPDARAAARIYPASYWFSLLDIPTEDEFPGTGPSGNGIAESMRTQSHWIDRMKSQCTQCHQLGTNATREIPRELGTFDSLAAAWDRRVKSSQAGSIMSGAMTGFGRTRALSMFSNWTDRITGGEIPPMPPRPQGVERNVVITQWDWADELAFVHDVTATDRRDPTLNPHGLVYGNDRYNAPDILTLDPVRHLARKDGLRASPRPRHSRIAAAVHAGVVSLLGRRAHLGQPAGKYAQPDARRARASVDDLDHPFARQPGVLQVRFRPSVRPCLSAGT